jgi:hypothetical protein
VVGEVAYFRLCGKICAAGVKATSVAAPTLDRLSRHETKQQRTNEIGLITSPGRSRRASPRAAWDAQWAAKQALHASSSKMGQQSWSTTAGRCVSV